jgi:hypothetical protein
MEEKEEGMRNDYGEETRRKRANRQKELIIFSLLLSL